MQILEIATHNWYFTHQLLINLHIITIMPNRNSENKITFAMDLALIGRLQIIYQIETNKVIKKNVI